jgi:uncharacterized membrane protein YeiH
MEIIILDIIGIIAFTISGYIVSTRADYDLLGIILISSISALGGGLVRDMILGITPFIFCTTYPLVVVIVVIVFAFLLKYHHSEALEENKLFVIADTIGLSVFAYSGSMAAIAAGFNLGGIIFLGLFTAIGGGMIRDIIMSKEIYTLRKGFYGTVAILVALLTFLIDSYIGISIIGTFLIIFLGICIRFIAIKYDWALPKII